MSFDPSAWLDEHRGKATLLGVCPMSPEIVQATLAEAASADEFVPMFIATPRQVDANRGYTGWSQTDLVDVVARTADAAGYDGPTILARDHGGPYQSTRDRGDPSISLPDAMEYAEELFIDDLEAGFDILHVDATEDATTTGPLDLEEIARRTVTLIDRIETHRERKGIPPVQYEVGTEEITGGMTAPEDFERFIENLVSALERAGRAPVVDRLLFVVGQIGTTMHIDMQNTFAPAKATELTDIVGGHNLHLKVHYTDWLDDEELARFPTLGIGAANVGPEFAAAMVDGYESLEYIEHDVVNEATDRSDFMTTFEAAAVRDAPWQKFAPAGLETDQYPEFAAEHRREIAHCVGRYVFTDADVEEARSTLYENVADHAEETDPHEVVVGAVRQSIRRYIEAFNLA